MNTLRIRGFALPDAEPADLYAAGDRWTDDPVAAAELVAEGWLLPGLVDVHTHPGAPARGRRWTRSCCARICVRTWRPGSR